MTRRTHGVRHSVDMTRGWGHSLRRTIRNLLAAATLVTLAACSSDSPAGPVAPVPSPNDPVAGAFTLNTVNALALPFTLFNDSGFVLEITASTMAMQVGGQFVMAMTTRETVAGFPSTFADTTRGTWTQNAGAVTLTATTGEAAAAVWDGVRLSFPTESDSRVLALVYRKD